MNRECRTCHWRKEGMLAVDPYECRRYPPTVVFTGNVFRSSWPIVKPTDWCGEWKKEKPE